MKKPDVTSVDGRSERKTNRQDVIVDALRGQIVRGDLPPGARLPNRVDLEESFAASSITVQKALERLKQDGFVVANRRSGTFVAPEPPHLAHFALVFPSHPGGAEWNHFWTCLCWEAQKLVSSGERRITIYYDVDGHEDSEDYQRLVRDVGAQRLAGIIFGNTADIFANTPLMENNPLPRVAISSNTRLKDLPIVTTEGNSFVECALHYLQERGCRRISVLTTAINPVQFEPAILGRGLETHPYWIQDISLWHPYTARGVAHLMFNPGQNSRPDGLIIANDNLLQHASEGLLAAGVRVPQELQVVSHCNFPWPTESIFPVHRIGFDTTQILRTCLNVLEARRAGASVPAKTGVQVTWDQNPAPLPLVHSGPNLAPVSALVP